MRLGFSGIPQPVALDGCDELIPTINAVLRGWQVGPVSENTETEPVITITKADGRYVRRSRWLSKPAVFSHPVNATCDFLVDLMKAYVEANRNLLCLHCSAVQFRDGLVIFPSSYKAGKSILAIGLARDGIRLFADDVLPIDFDAGQGLAPGFLPRPRLPLPDDAMPGLKAFVEEHAGPRSKRFVYLDFDEAKLASLGECAPIQGVVLLDRTPDSKPALSPATTSEILKSAIRRNFSHNLSGIDTLDRLSKIVAGTRQFHLRYRTAGTAMELLKNEFGD